MLIGIFYSQIVESSSLVFVLFREAISHPYISFFHLLVNGFSVIYTYIWTPTPITLPCSLALAGNNAQKKEKKYHKEVYFSIFLIEVHLIAVTINESGYSTPPQHLQSLLKWHPIKAKRVSVDKEAQKSVFMRLTN